MDRVKCHKSAEAIQADSLLLTTESPGVPGTHSIHLGKVKGQVKLGATYWYSTPGLGIQSSNY